VVGLARWEGQEQPLHQHSQRQHQNQALCIPEMHNTVCIVPSGLPATL
jgi:hypothetical protein